MPELIDDATLGDWAAAAGALFTALAALAALLTARQGRQLIEAAERPLLEVQVLADPDRERMLRLAIINSGRGVARNATFAVHALGQATDNVIGDGYMQPGQRVHVLTNIGPLPVPVGQLRGDVEDLGVMVSWRDAEGFAHYRTHAEENRTPRTWLRRRPKYPDRVAIFRGFFPHIDLERAERVTHNIVAAE